METIVVFLLEYLKQNKPQHLYTPLIVNRKEEADVVIV